jgi:hypothetical protein
MQGAKPLCGHLHLGSPGIAGPKEDLPREIGDFNLIGVDEPKPPKAGGRKVQGNRASQATNPNNGGA